MNYIFFLIQRKHARMMVTSFLSRSLTFKSSSLYCIRVQGHNGQVSRVISYRNQISGASFASGKNLQLRHATMTSRVLSEHHEVLQGQPAPRAKALHHVQVLASVHDEARGAQAEHAVVQLQDLRCAREHCD